MLLNPLHVTLMLVTPTLLNPLHVTLILVTPMLLNPLHVILTIVTPHVGESPRCTTHSSDHNIIEPHL